MTIIFMIVLLFALLLYVFLMYRCAQAVRRRYAGWTPRRFVTVSFFTGPILILVIGLITASILSERPGGSDQYHRTGGALAFMAINALALGATIPAAIIGYVIERRILAREGLGSG